MKTLNLWAGSTAGFFLALAIGCQTDGPHVGSQTNWLRACDASIDCGNLVCLCGTCTLSCDGANDCEALGTDSCVFASEMGATAICDGTMPTAGMCLPHCGDLDEPCPSGSSCVAGVCVGTPEVQISVAIDPEVRFQTLVGIGASLAYNEHYIANHPKKEALFDAMFAESGFDALRVRNGFDGTNVTNLAAVVDIIAGATARLGFTPAIFLTSGSPPKELKANGNTYCDNLDPDCTLIQNVEGEFDYAGFAEYWRASLDAYETAGMHADYVSVQNHPNWVPPDELGAEACRFLPTEGTTTLSLPDGTSVEATFPGYAEAMQAIVTAAQTLPDSYAFIGPETGSQVLLEDFSDALSQVDGLAVSFYSIDSASVDTDLLRATQALSEERSQLVFQTEVQRARLDAAVLVHHALSDAGVSAYFTFEFVAPTDDPNDSILIGGDAEDFRKHDTYFSLAHFARFTDPGWSRIAVDAADNELLTSGFLSPDGETMTVVIINPGSTALQAGIELPDEASDFFQRATVWRTVFDGAERMVNLGPLPPERALRLPPRSIVTLTSQEE